MAARSSAETVGSGGKERQEPVSTAATSDPRRTSCAAGRPFELDRGAFRIIGSLKARRSWSSRTPAGRLPLTQLWAHVGSATIIDRCALWRRDLYRPALTSAAGPPSLLPRLECPLTLG